MSFSFYHDPVNTFKRRRRIAHQRAHEGNAKMISREQMNDEDIELD
jgi:hypothetical protein